MTDYEIIVIVLGIVGLVVHQRLESNKINRNIENVENWYSQRAKKDAICKLDEEIKELKERVHADAATIIELKGKITILEALLAKSGKRR